MNSQIAGLRVASVVFGLMAIAQLVRVVIRPEVLVGPSDAVMAKCAGFHFPGRSESLDVETHAPAHRVNEIGHPGCE